VRQHTGVQRGLGPGRCGDVRHERGGGPRASIPPRSCASRGLRHSRGARGASSGVPWQGPDRDRDRADPDEGRLGASRSRRALAAARRGPARGSGGTSPGGGHHLPRGPSLSSDPRPRPGSSDLPGARPGAPLPQRLCRRTVLGASSGEGRSGHAGHRRGAGGHRDGARRMRSARTAALVLAPALLAVVPASAQPVEHAEHEEHAWSFGASFSWYFLREQADFGVVTATADHGPIHLEARYNYEAKRTASTFVGWNFEFGETVTFGITPIVGCMFGEAGGPILGLEVAVGWGPLSFSSQGEGVTDVQGDTGGVLYHLSG